MASSPFKKIIVCCDGTWNDSDGTNQPPTNVTKIARSIAHENQNNGTGKVIPQLVYYQSGIGTKSPNDADHLYDGMFGRGKWFLMLNVEEEEEISSALAKMDRYI